MPATAFTYPGSPPDPMQVVGLQRSAALARVLNFENTMHRRLGMVRPQRYIRLANYYMSQNLPPDNVLQPLAINYYKTICDKHVSYLWGQWQQKGRLLPFRCTPRGNGDLVEDQTSVAIERYISDLWDANDGNALLWEASHNGSVYGDSVFRLRWDPVERRVAVETILPEWFHCRWDATNMNRLTEVIISYPIDRLDCQEKYGTSGNPAINYQLINPEYVPGFAIYWEHWTPTSYRQWIDDICIREEQNPYMRYDAEGNIYPGIIPFVHIPNMRVGGEYYGFADPESVIFLQDELNRRLADMGDAINNHAHPIIALQKYVGDVEELQVGPDAVWDLGREGIAEYLQWKGTPPAVIEYLQLLLQIMNDGANLPDIAYGRGMRGGGGAGSGGAGGRSGVSGIALQMAMMPVVERASQKRIFWRLGTTRIVNLATFIHAVMDPATLPFDYAVYGRYNVEPEFASILPRDRMQAVNENVALTQGALRSTQRALEDLGEDNIGEEEKRIKGDLQFKAKVQSSSSAAPQMAGPMGGRIGAKPGGSVPKPFGGKNGDKGQGGSNALPGGPGAADKKSSTPAAKEAS